MDLTTFPTNRADASEANYAKIMITKFRDGVYRDYLQSFEVYADSTGVQVKVKPGAALLGGFEAELASQTVLALDSADSSYPRIDRVILQLDRTDPSTISLEVLTGNPASSPAAPSLTNNSTISQLSLAQVRVDATVGTIVASRVSDERTYQAVRGTGTVLPSRIYSTTGKAGTSGWPADAGHEHPIDVAALRNELFPAGTVIAYASGASVPDGWLVGDGRAVSRSTYIRLWQAIGTTYGSGDGSTTFNLPDYRGYFLRGTYSQSGQPTGTNGGHDRVTLSESQIPSLKPGVNADTGDRFIFTSDTGGFGIPVWNGTGRRVDVTDIDYLGHEFPSEIETLPAYRAVQWIIKAH